MKTTTKFLTGAVSAFVLLLSAAVSETDAADTPVNPTQGEAKIPDDSLKASAAKAWDQTKEGAAKTGDAIAEKSGEAWDKTKEISGKAWDKTKEVSGETWDKTKEAGSNAWETAKDTVAPDGKNASAAGDDSSYSRRFHQDAAQPESLPQN
ncbi:MAG: hypothetical protein IJ482_07630 [Alphaproteobacteria bacterium]|nr:hypothetical protein [Alphaproteobacteria bacterium]